jgi:hypothetical protein
VEQLSIAELEEEVEQLSWQMHLIQIMGNDEGPFAGKSQQYVDQRYRALAMRRREVLARLGPDAHDPLRTGLAKEGQRIECPQGVSVFDCAKTPPPEGDRK